MTKRRAGRIAALQALFGLDMRGLLGGNGGATADDADEALRRARGSLDDAGDGEELSAEEISAADVPLDPEAEAFARELCRGVVEHGARIDELLGRCAVNWRVERMGYVDRNVLRLATFELSERPQVPAGAAINEAVELGKVFGATESAAFINGVLDRVARELGR